MSAGANRDAPRGDVSATKERRSRNTRVEVSVLLLLLLVASGLIYLFLRVLCCGQ